MDTSTLVIAGIVILVMLAFLYPVFVKSRKVNLTGKTADKPDWMRETPPRASSKASLADNEGVTVFDHDEGEKIASPFVEQIEDILRARMDADPYFKQFEIDLGTGADGGLEIWVNGEKYTDIKTLPDEKLKQAFAEAVKQWDRKK